MPCYYPLDGYFGKDVNPRTGKRPLVFNRSGSLSGIAVKVPCGQCIGCRLEHSRQWAMRCVHEGQMHVENCFVTLTYDDDHLPEGMSLVKRDMQLFMKRLRKNKGKGVRFYGCGEYGERTSRPHYHAILFNCDFHDKVLFKRTGDAPYYTSKLLSTLWPAGHNVISDLTFDTAAYVARYVVKKVTGDGAAAHYDVVDEYGEIHARQSEFALMSRRPGIGRAWFDKYGRHSYAWDSVIVNGREVKPPKYYDIQFEVLDSDRLAMLKLGRRRKAAKSRLDNTAGRRRVKEVVALAKLRQKGRVL